MFNVKMSKVDSSNINAIGYQEEHTVLTVEFKKGGVYCYIGVTRTMWEQLQASSSIGSALHKSVLNNSSLVVIKEDDLDVAKLLFQLKGLKMLIEQQNKLPSKIQLNGLLEKTGIVLPKVKEEKASPSTQSTTASTTVKTVRRKKKANPRSRM